MQPEVAVVVVTYFSADVIGDLLDSIPGAMGEHSYEIVVVDNGSGDDTVEVVRRRAGLRVVERENNGYSAGINVGAAELPDSETILVLNPDVRLSPGSVVEMLRRMRSTGAGIVAPHTVTTSGETALTLRRKPTLLRATGLSSTARPVFSEHVQEPERYLTPHVVQWAVGSVLLVSRRTHEALGGWDESYFLYSEETDFCLRAGDHGFQTFYEPAARVMHIGGASGRSGRTEIMQTLNRIRLYARRHGKFASTLYFLMIVVSELRGLVRGDVKARAAVRALLVPGARPEELNLGASLVPR